MRLLSELKQKLVPAGKKIRTLKGGVCCGMKMNIDLRHQTQTYLGLYEAELIPWLRKLSVGIHSAADLGTANGFYTLFFLGKTQAEAIYSFDPLEEEKTDYLVNLEANGFRDGQRVHHQMKFLGERVTSDMATLDSLELDQRGPTLIKMDIEKAEVDALKGAKNLLESDTTRWVIETHSYDLEVECLKILKEAGYQTRVVPNAWWRVLFPEKRFGHNRWIVASKDLRL